MKKIQVYLFCLITFSQMFSQIPDYEFITPPIDLMENFYDYMPGSYNVLPVQIEADGSVYIVFHARETETSTRRVYFAYLDANGNLSNIGLIGTEDIHEGFPGIDLDPLTGAPLVAWHGNFDPTTTDAEVVMSYAHYHLGNPGQWREPFIVFDDDIPTFNHPEDCFIWPEVHVGPSPITDKRRVYVIGKNYEPSPITGSPSENVLIGFADFDENDLNTQSELEWSYRTVDLLDQWHNGNPEWVRPLVSCAVSDDGQIALIGYIAADFENSPLTDQIIVFHNDNFGEGDFDFYFQEAHYEVWNPFPGATEQLYFAPYLCNHQSSIFHAGNSQISFLGTMNLLFEPSSWYPDLPLLFTKVFNFDVNTQEFSFYDLYIEGANPADNTPMIPWDLDEDGIVDSLGPNGEILYVEGWPIYYFASDLPFQESNLKMTKNEENGWLAAIWNDGLKARKAAEGVPGYENWLEKPEIAICISANNGESWSQPIFLNANETPELAGMIPVYVYPGDKIEDLGNEHGKLHLFFLDDYYWGSTIQGQGEDLGGMQKYCSLDIDFGSIASTPEMVVPASDIYLTNFPNPFNPSTTISFNLTAKGTKIEIYNLKGQRVKILPVSPSQSHKTSVVWNGTDQNNKPVSSGIYFAALRVDGRSLKTKKMMLMK